MPSKQIVDSLRPFEAIETYEVLFKQQSAFRETLILVLQHALECREAGTDPKQDPKVRAYLEISAKYEQTGEPWLSEWRDVRVMLENEAPDLLEYFPAPNIRHHNPKELAEKAAHVLGQLLSRQQAQSKRSGDHTNATLGRATESYRTTPGLEPMPDAEEDGVEEWIATSSAVKKARQNSFSNSLTWLTRDASKHGVRLRPRPKSSQGRHRQEVEWSSLAKYLITKVKPEDIEDESPETQSRLEKAKKDKKLRRPLD
jgi:hypothetical protein